MDHKGFMKSKDGKKIIIICRILARDIASVKEIKSKLESENLIYSRSEIYKLLQKAEKFQWIEAHELPKTRRRRGKPITGKFEKKTGRPNKFYSLTAKGLFYMRFDPELVDDWEKVEEKYSEISHPLLDSFNNLRYAIEQHSSLSKFKERPDFNGILQRRPLNPLLFDRCLEDEEFDELSDELVRLIKENVIPGYIKPYRTSLEDSVKRLRKAIKRHKILIEKIKTIEK
jgi:DNA-binding PadR family transcriptional regulator